MHAHLARPDVSDSPGPQHLPFFLANGVTTVRSLFGRPVHLEWRDAAAAGTLLGPPFTRLAQSRSF